MAFKERVKNLQKELAHQKVDALLVDDVINLYYLTGLQLSEGKLIVHKKGAHLLADSRYYELCKKSCPFPVKLYSGLKSLEDLLKDECSFVKTFAFDSTSTTYQNYENLKKSFKKVGRKIELEAVAGLVSNLRGIKDTDEIKRLRAAAVLGAKGFDFICSQLRKGITEIELANAVEIFWKQHGAKGLAFDPIIAFGANGAMPHYRAGNVKLKKGDPVLIDIGVLLDHYHSDMTRVVYFGEPDPQILEIHAIVQEAQKRALKLCKPGSTIGALDRAAREYIEKQGYGDKFIHRLGHGVGLQIHEWPSLKNEEPYKNVKLEEGVVITIEPGIYISGLGGVRIEDTVVITKKGHENLTNRPTEPVII